MQYTIVGAGIGGLTTALVFEKLGIDYQLFEKASESSEVGAGIWLAPNALQVYDYLGILEEVTDAGNIINHITVGQSDFTPLSDQSQDRIEEIFGFTTVAIHRATLQALLIKRIPKEKLHLGHAFKSFENLDSGKVRVHFTNQSTIDTDYLIGADGIHSKVREQLFPNSQLRYSGQTCWRGIADIELEEDLVHKGAELWGDSVRFGFSKVAPNTVYWFAVAQSKPRLKDIGDVKEKLITMFSDFHPLVNTLIQSTDRQRILKHDINDLSPMNTWYSNHVVLIGDAGHATTPNMGQGGAQAIEDAYYLGQIIKANKPEDVFKMFQSKRQKKVNTIVQQSWITGKMAHWTYGKGIRNMLLKYMPSSLLEKKMIEMYRL